MAVLQIITRDGNGIKPRDPLCPIKIVQELSPELDSGEVSYIQSGEMEAVAPFTRYRIAQDSPTDDSSNAYEFFFVGIEECALLRAGTNQVRGLSKHAVALTEPAKLLEGTLIDGFGVTQDEALSLSIKAVINRLFAQANLDRQGEFTLVDSNPILEKTPCPEFKWNPQTTLWECLEQIGAVIDAIPAIVPTYLTNQVCFKYINSSDSVADELIDAYAQPHGESFAENQYNSSLGSVVENLLEE